MKQKRNFENWSCPQILNTCPSFSDTLHVNKSTGDKSFVLSKLVFHYEKRLDNDRKWINMQSLKRIKNWTRTGCRRDLQINKQFKIIFVDKFGIDGWVRICPTFSKFMRLMKKLGALKLLVHIFRASFIKQSHVIRLSLVFSSPLQQSVEFFRFFFFISEFISN